MSKLIIGRFNKDNKILFYSVEDSWKHYLIIKSQPSGDYYLYNRANKSLTKQSFRILNVPDDKNIYSSLIHDDHYTWEYNKVFFEANSPFVDKCGLPEHKVLLKMYRSLEHLIATDNQMRKDLEDIYYSHRIYYFILRLKMRYNMFKQNRALRKVIKEYRIIW